MIQASIRTRFTAPFGKEIRLATPLVLVICVGVVVIGFTAVPEKVAWARWLTVATGIFIPLFSWFCQIREYRLEDGQLIIRQRLWNNRLPLAELRGFRADPEAMKGTVQVCGNGGVFAIYGFYWNKVLGSFRAYASDLKRAVILRFSHRTIVISPDSPEDFLRALEQLTKLNHAAESAPAEVGKSYQA